MERNARDEQMDRKPDAYIRLDCLSKYDKNIVYSIQTFYKQTDIAPDKGLFFIQKVLIFFLFLHNNIHYGTH